MATPNKKTSPYSTPLQYPSQSPDYISLEIGGPNRNNFKMQQPYKNRDSQSPYQANSNHRKQQSYNNNRSGFYANKKKHLNNTPKKSEYDFSMYFHPSMLQDPWENLMKRYESVCASKITPKETPTSE